VRFLTINWCLFLLVWVIGAFSVKPTKERESLASRWVTVAYVAATVMLVSMRVKAPVMNIRVLPGGAVWRIIGDAIACAGLITAVWARVTLAGNWSGTITFKEDHELIRRGPYRWVRHPIYTGILLMVLGTAIVFGRLGPFLGLAICFIGTWRKLRREEALLTKHFPGAYPDYMSRTRALVPFLL
jgi:protein-S-isoprenylcysteine O-methyltransferase Ste14